MVGVYSSVHFLRGTLTSASGGSWPSSGTLLCLVSTCERKTLIQESVAQCLTSLNEATWPNFYNLVMSNLQKKSATMTKMSSKPFPKHSECDRCLGFMLKAAIGQSGWHPGLRPHRCSEFDTSALQCLLCLIESAAKVGRDGRCSPSSASQTPTDPVPRACLPEQNSTEPEASVSL